MDGLDLCSTCTHHEASRALTCSAEAAYSVDPCAIVVWTLSILCPTVKRHISQTPAIPNRMFSSLVPCTTRPARRTMDLSSNGSAGSLGASDACPALRLSQPVSRRRTCPRMPRGRSFEPECHEDLKGYRYYTVSATENGNSKIDIMKQPLSLQHSQPPWASSDRQ